MPQGQSMNTTTLPEVQDLVSDETKQTEQIIPEVTATDAEDQKEEQVKPARTFSQEEVDALIQKRLLKEERRVHRRIEAQFREEQGRQEPKREAFQNDQAYINAQIEHQAEAKATEILEKRERERESVKLMDSFDERVEKAAERYPDFDSVARNPDLQINPAMAKYISRSEMGPDPGLGSATQSRDPSSDGPSPTAGSSVTWPSGDSPAETSTGRN